MIQKCEWNTQCDYLFNVPRTYWYINLQIKTDLKAITSNNSEKHCEKKPWRTEESDHLLFNWHQPLTRCKNTHKRFFGIHVYASAIIQGDMLTEVFLHIRIYQGIDSISAIYNSSLTRFFLLSEVLHPSWKCFTPMETSKSTVKDCTFEVYSALMTTEQWGIINVLHRTSVLKIILQGSLDDMYTRCWHGPTCYQ